jgi:hypothetical protein
MLRIDGNFYRTDYGDLPAMSTISTSRSWPAALAMLFLMGGFFAACDDTPPEETRPVATAVLETQPPPTMTEPAATQTAEPTSTQVPPAETPLPTEPPPTNTPQPTATNTAEPTATAAPMSLVPGFEETASIEAGSFKAYTYVGTAFEPLFIFVEADATLNVAVAAYREAINEGADLSGVSPLAVADFNPVNRPEILVFTAPADGSYSLVVSSSEETAGAFTLHAYDTETPVENAMLVSESLVIGESRAYTAQSNSGRPVLIFLDPIDQSDLIFDVIDGTGTVVGSANFGGRGSPEAFFLLPLSTTSYTVQVREASGAAAAYNLVIVALP